MGLITILAIGVALAMDAFAVAIVAGVTLSALTRRHLFRLAFHFGLFQSLMLVAGWCMGAALQRTVAAYDHWIAFGLLAAVGLNILRGSLSGDDSRTPADPTAGLSLVMLSIATSLDALAVGLSLALIGTSITLAAIIIGITAAAFTLTGMKLGRRIGLLWRRRVEFAGGLILILIGLQIVWNHTMA